jgi:ribosome-associated heat shock protein Hsp15
MRIDKWMWAARFFKTRGLASDACDLNRIECNGVRAKASREVKVGNMLVIRNEAGEFTVEVLALSEMRGPATVAATLFRETDESKELRLKVAEERKMMLAGGGVTDGRPSKQDRRQINALRGRIHRF